MLDFRLKVFRSVAKNLSFTKASNDLFISQPAITKHIKELETAYNLRFFDRKGNNICLTRAGEVLLGFTEKMIKLNHELDAALNTFKSTVSGALRLGASTTIAQYAIPQVLSKFHAYYTKIRLGLLNGNTEQIRKALLNGEIDLGIVEGKGRTNDIKYEPFISDEVVAVTSNRGNLAHLDAVSLNDLVSLPLVLRERGSGTLEVIEYELKKKGVKLASLNVIMSLGSTESLKAFIEASDCIGFIPVRAIEHELLSGVLKIIEIKDFRIYRNFEFIYLQGPEASGLNRVFIEFAKEFYNLK